MAAAEKQGLPEQGAVLTFGRSWFADNQASRFWIKNDKIVACACGDDHTIVLTETHRVFSFGTGEFGQLGLGDTKSATRPSCVKALKPENCTIVACGKAHTLISTESGQLFAFGLNQDGQLGLGHTDSVETPAEVVPWSGRAVQIDAGAAHTVTLTEDGRVFAWGSNSEGQCGLGGVESAHQPTLVTCPDKIVKISCGHRHTAFVTADGRLLVCGSNEFGQLGLEGGKGRASPTPVDGLAGVTAVACGGRHTLVLLGSGEVFCFGDGSSGQLGLGEDLVSAPTARRLPLGEASAVGVAAGFEHSAVILADGRLLTFGSGQHGKLCLADSDCSVFVPTAVADLEHVQVTGVSLGGCQSMLLVDRLASPRMLGDLPPLTNGLHDRAETATSSGRPNTSEADAALPPVSRVLPPLRGAPRISPSASQQEAEAGHSSGLLQLRDAADLQSVSSASDIRPPTAQKYGERTTQISSSVFENGCSQISKLFSRFRKSKTSASNEIENLSSPEETEVKEEPDDESRPEGAARAVPGGDVTPGQSSPDKSGPTPASDADPAAVPAEAGDTASPPNVERSPPQQSKTCRIL